MTEITDEPTLEQAKAAMSEIEDEVGKIIDLAKVTDPEAAAYITRHFRRLREDVEEFFVRQEP